MNGDLDYDKNGIYQREFENLKSEIVSLKKDINRVLQRSNSHYNNALLMEMRSDFSRPVLQYMLQNTKETLNEGFCSDCDKTELCKTAFSNLLQEMALLLVENRFSEEALESFRERFDELKSFAPNDKCDACVLTVSKVFDNQMELMYSFINPPEKTNAYGDKLNLNEIPEDVVTDICEPLANRQRLLILRSLNSDSMSFSEISKITGLRGGNLLFHIQKLLDTNMVLQKAERGDYVITKKGHLTLKGMAELYEKLSNI